MLKKLFFSFNYERDFWRANEVRNAWVSQHGEAEGFWEEAAWLKAKEMGPIAIQQIIDDSIAQSIATVVLISPGTCDLDYIQYAIRQSRKMNKGVIGIYIHNIEDQNGKKEKIGAARFGEIDKDENGKSLFFFQLYPIYRWIIDNGELNLKRWIDKAVKASSQN